MNTIRNAITRRYTTHARILGGTPFTTSTEKDACSNCIKCKEREENNEKMVKAGLSVVGIGIFGIACGIAGAFMLTAYVFTRR